MSPGGGRLGDGGGRTIEEDGSSISTSSSPSIRPPRRAMTVWDDVVGEGLIVGSSKQMKERETERVCVERR
jgi:hypothetical protein